MVVEVANTSPILRENYLIQRNRRTRLFKALIALSLLALIQTLNFIWLRFLPWDELAQRREVLYLYFFVIIIYLPFRILTYSAYKPPEQATDYPPISVIIPVYNEGQMVYECLKSIVEAFYPN